MGGVLRATQNPTESDLPAFREVQQLAYRGAETIAGELQPGVTEKQTAERLRHWLLDHGVDDWFHLPFAWFGDRTAFRGVRVAFDFFPGNRRLEAGMPFILDCAPVVDGVTADIGYSGVIGENATLDRILDDLAEHRALILAQVKERRRFRDIYAAVDRLAAEQGYENRHRKYPFGVIAHEVWKLPARPGPVLGSRAAFRFGLRNVEALFRTAAVARRQGWSPLWNGRRQSDHAPVPGLWAVEPHLGVGGVGAKFEELLVVTDDDAYWLDDDLPHVRRWEARGVTPAPRARSLST
ncbi:MAG: M24 family metallopeptidase [Acidimicrobiales bacterium]